MVEQQQMTDMMGSTLYDSSGDKIGKVGQIYTDDQTGEPSWATVNTGFFGTSESFVPIREASFSSDGLRVPYAKDKVKDAPNVASDGHLSPEEERELYSYYGVGYDDSASYDTTTTEVGYDTTTTETTQTTGTTDDAMTRSEERIEVGTANREAGRARLRKYVVTENVTQTIPVRKEKAVLEREPITDANVGDATSGADFTEGEVEVVLHEEVPVVQKTVQPVERVRLGTEEVTGEETVSEEVRKERIEADGDVTGTGTVDTDGLDSNR